LKTIVAAARRRQAYKPSRRGSGAVRFFYKPSRRGSGAVACFYKPSRCGNGSFSAAMDKSVTEIITLNQQSNETCPPWRGYLTVNPH
jgi:aspartate carbamoyltransferase catalytic subunit